MRNIEISIVVVTYNFEKIILECLEGIEKQTYKNFEVIIADDASKDKTIEICETWKEKVTDKFPVTIIKSENNEGVTKNINKGARLAVKEWVKILAGDDILKKDALENFVYFINEYSEAKIIFSKAQEFYSKDRKKMDLEIIPKEINFYKMSIKKQLKNLLEFGNCIVAPAYIIKNELLKEMNYFDEKYKMVEDYPFWIKLLKNDVKFYFLNKVTVEYRRSPSSVSGKKKNEAVNPVIFEFEKQFYKDIYLQEAKNPFRIWDKFIDIKSKEIMLNNNNNKNFYSKLLRKLRIKKMKTLFYKIIIIFFVLYFFIKYFYNDRSI